MELENEKFDMEAIKQDLDYIMEVEEQGPNAKGIIISEPKGKFSSNMFVNYKDIKRYLMELPEKMVENSKFLHPSELLAFFLMINLTNCRCDLPSAKPKRTALTRGDYNSYEIRVMDGIYVPVGGVGYKKLLYHDHKFNETEFHKFPIFSLSEEVFPLCVRLKPKRVFVERDFYHDFTYIGEGKFALIERKDWMSQEQAISERMDSIGKIGNLRYKRKVISYDDVDLYNQFYQIPVQLQELVGPNELSGSSNFAPLTSIPLTFSNVSDNAGTRLVSSSLGFPSRSNILA